MYVCIYVWMYVCVGRFFLKFMRVAGMMLALDCMYVCTCVCMNLVYGRRWYYVGTELYVCVYVHMYSMGVGDAVLA